MVVEVDTKIYTVRDNLTNQGMVRDNFVQIIPSFIELLRAPRKFIDVHYIPVIYEFLQFIIKRYALIRESISCRTGNRMSIIQ